MPYRARVKGGDKKDSPTNSPFPHMRAEKTGQPEHRKNVDPKHLGPVLLRRLRQRPAKVIGARAVDKDRYLAELRNGKIKYLSGSLLTGEICRDERPGSPIRRDIVDCRLPSLDVDIRADQLSAFARDRFRKSPSYRASDAGYQSRVLCEEHNPNLSRQIRALKEAVASFWRGVLGHNHTPC